MNARQTIDLFATLGDMKDVAYKNSLAIAALIELLVTRGIITQTEFNQLTRRLNTASEVYQSAE